MKRTERPQQSMDVHGSGDKLKLMYRGDLAQRAVLIVAQEHGVLTDGSNERMSL